MATFTLRSSDTASALRSATLDTLRARTFTAGWHLYVDGVDAVTRIPLETWRITDSGPSATGRLEAEHLDPTRAYAIPAGAFVELVDGTGESVYWGGYVSSRDVLPFSPAGRLTRIEAVDIGSALDTAFIPSHVIPAGWDDRRAVQALVAAYGRRGLYAPDSTVELTDTSLPEVTITNLTLRQAINLVGDSAGESRVVWVDALGRVNYGRSAIAPAPYAITDSAPNGTTTIAVSELAIDFDESAIVNAVYISGPTTGSFGYAAWVEDATSIGLYGRREGWLTNEAVVDSVTATLYGTAHLAKTKDPAVRGSFVVEGFNGWKAGQALTVTSTPLGLSGATYQITEVVTTWQTGTGRRSYSVSFGALSKSLTRAIAETIG